MFCGIIVFEFWDMERLVSTYNTSEISIVTHLFCIFPADSMDIQTRAIWKSLGGIAYAAPRSLLRLAWEVMRLMLSGAACLIYCLVYPFSWLSSVVTRLAEDQYSVAVVKHLKIGTNTACSASCPFKSSLLPPMSEKHRGMLTVVLDLDETLITSYPKDQVPQGLSIAAQRGDVSTFEMVCGSATGSTATMTVFARPGLQKFLSELSRFAEVVLFTAGLPSYAEPLLSLLDPMRQNISASLFRDSTLQAGKHAHVKDLSRLGRDLRRTVLVDNNPFSFLLQPANGIPCMPFKGQPNDCQLLGVILPLLQCLSNVKDIRPILHNHLKMAKWFRSKGCHVPVDNHL